MVFTSLGFEPGHRGFKILAVPRASSADKYAVDDGVVTQRDAGEVWSAILNLATRVHIIKGVYLSGGVVHSPPPEHPPQPYANWFSAVCRCRGGLQGKACASNGKLETGNPNDSLEEKMVTTANRAHGPSIQ